MAFVESYKKRIIVANYISILPTIWLSIMFFLTFPGNLNLYLIAGEDYDRGFLNEIFIAFFFQISLFVLFVIRFLFLCFSKSKFIWTSQILWLVNWLVFVVYFMTSQILSYPFIPVPGCDHCYPTIFMGALFVIQQWFFGYLIFSPIKQISTLTFSYFYRK